LQWALCRHNNEPLPNLWDSVVDRGKNIDVDMVAKFDKFFFYDINDHFFLFGLGFHEIWYIFHHHELWLEDRTKTNELPKQTISRIFGVATTGVCDRKTLAGWTTKNNVWLPSGEATCEILIRDPSDVLGNDGCIRMVKLEGLAGPLVYFYSSNDFTASLFKPKTKTTSASKRIENQEISHDHNRYSLSNSPRGCRAYSIIQLLVRLKKIRTKLGSPWGGLRSDLSPPGGSI